MDCESVAESMSQASPQSSKHTELARSPKQALLSRLQTPQTSTDTCVICLCAITERAVACPCNHLAFDFLCLVSWLQERAVCPLCKTPVTSVEYELRSHDDYKTYQVPCPSKDAQQQRETRYIRPRARRLNASRPPTNGSRNRHARQPYFQPTTDAALARRRLVYELMAHSLYVGANRVSEYKDLTPLLFTSSPSLQSRARLFPRRELSVFVFLQNAHSRAEFLLEYVVGMLKMLDIKAAGGEMEDLVAEFLGRRHAALFLHELEAWLRSPYIRLDDWDRHVQYREPTLAYDKPIIIITRRL